MSNAILTGLLWCSWLGSDPEPAQPPVGPTPHAQALDARRPRDDAELRSWLQNMVWYHRFTTEEITAATGLSAEEITGALGRLAIRPDQRPTRPADAPLLVLPYPGGRHPRKGFFVGAVRPQRETKVSVFTPWDPASYVVVDVPEAIWVDTDSGRQLLYLAHTHIPTLWDQQGVVLEKLEWQRRADGTLFLERRLPNRVAFGTKIIPGKDAVRMEMWLCNGSDKSLRGLVVQNCVMLRSAAGFAEQTDQNKIDRHPYSVCRSAEGGRWLITAWVPCHRVWGNPECPCMHSDPQFPDCPAGQTRRLLGWLSFYEGTDLDAELRRIEATGWRSGVASEPHSLRHGPELHVVGRRESVAAVPQVALDGLSTDVQVLGDVLDRSASGRQL